MANKKSILIQCAVHGNHTNLDFSCSTCGFPSYCENGHIVCEYCWSCFCDNKSGHLKDCDQNQYKIALQKYYKKNPETKGKLDELSFIAGYLEGKL